jgi:hypothetical protein
LAIFDPFPSGLRRKSAFWERVLICRELEEKSRFPQTSESLCECKI